MKLYGLLVTILLLGLAVPAAASEDDIRAALGAAAQLGRAQAAAVLAQQNLRSAQAVFQEAQDRALPSRPLAGKAGAEALMKPHSPTNNSSPQAPAPAAAAGEPKPQSAPSAPPK